MALKNGSTKPAFGNDFRYEYLLLGVISARRFSAVRPVAVC
jgi:hypothetical protein